MTKEQQEEVSALMSRLRGLCRELRDEVDACKVTRAELRSIVSALSKSPVSQVADELRRLPELREAYLEVTRPSTDLKIAEARAATDMAKLQVIATGINVLGPSLVALLQDKQVAERIANLAQGATGVEFSADDIAAAAAAAGGAE